MKEIGLTKETDPRLIQLSENKFSFVHEPHFGLLVPGNTLLITGLAFAAFNPSSLPILKLLKIGDLVKVRSSNKSSVYKVWDPPEEYQIPDNYSEIFEVTNTTIDSLGYPILVLKSV